MNIDASNSTFEREVTRLAIRIRALDTLSLALTCSSVWLLAWGIVVLALRATASGVNSRLLLFGMAGAVPAVYIAILVAQRRAPNRQAVRALLDRQNNCGGLLMAAGTARLGEWSKLMPGVNAPRLRWRGGRRVALLAAALSFLLASFLAPARFGADYDQPLDIARQVEQLAAEAEALKQEKIIDQSRIESLQSQLDAVRSEASGKDPAKTWEALDRLEQNLSDTSAEAAEKLAKTSEDLGKSEALAQALATDGSALDNKTATDAMKQLSKMAEAASSEAAQFGKGLPEDALAGLKSGSLNANQLRQLAEALGKSKGEIAKRLGNLREANLIDLGTFKKCEGTGDVDSEGLAAFLAENGNKMSVAEAMGLWGKGGIDRGRGDAPMTWTEGTREQGAKFKEQVIPPSAIAGLKESQLVGRSTGAPSVEKGHAATTGALAGASAGGGSSFSQTILPRHKGAVRRYFAR